ncbi:hypothetical protein PsYK624_137170 [Phanerochaete sordida]|uniref:Uncharacterized protein n=1 Tax=Phanerochaete sordida TaxID=48140 RepID=A0A9P3LJF9_9APHY|nr:hypothetical protein PsYK624_137170 [Phanerochaete sordida]
MRSGRFFHQGAVIAASFWADNEGWLCADVAHFLVPTSTVARRPPPRGFLSSRRAEFAGRFSQYGDLG